MYEKCVLANLYFKKNDEFSRFFNYFQDFCKRFLQRNFMQFEISLVYFSNLKW